jgi:hypothetical protein
VSPAVVKLKWNKDQGALEAFKCQTQVRELIVKGLQCHLHIFHLVEEVVRNANCFECGHFSFRNFSSRNTGNADRVPVSIHLFTPVLNTCTLPLLSGRHWAGCSPEESRVPGLRWYQKGSLSFRPGKSRTSQWNTAQGCAVLLRGCWQPSLAEYQEGSNNHCWVTVNTACPSPTPPGGSGASSNMLAFVWAAERKEKFPCRKHLLE